MSLSLTLDALARLTEAKAVEGDAAARAVRLTGIAALSEAGPSDLSFLGNARYAAEVAATRAGAVLVPADHPGSPAPGQAFVRVDRPSYALALVCAAVEASLWPRPPAGIHPSASVDPAASVDPTAHVGPGCTLLAGAKVGPRAVLEAQCHLGAGASVGADSWLKPRVTIADHCAVGERCRLQSGAVVGSDGFGYEPVGDRIERILVQVAHNVRIGRQCLVAAQVGIAGSTVLGDGCVLGGQAGVAGHLRLGDGVRLGAQAGLFEDVPAGAFMNGSPAVPIGLERRMAVLARRLPELFKKVDSLAAALDALRKDAP